MADTRGFEDSKDGGVGHYKKGANEKTGPYIATVKYTADPLRMGRLGVNIPALSNTTDPTADQVIWVQYLSPFYGTKDVRATTEKDPYNFKESQHAYGFWAVPPDVGSTVLVIFAQGQGKASQGFWIGCVQDPITNQTVPGHGATNAVAQSGRDEGTPAPQSQMQKEYGTTFLPAGEINRKAMVKAKANTLSSLADWKYPINDLLANQLRRQGLVQDPTRGTTSSSARREAPSQVFGMSTPGRLRGDSARPRIGLERTEVFTDRAQGHSFVMDDGDLRGANQLIRFRTSSGHQLLMHDSEGVIYLANSSGNAWLEMNAEGRIDMYSGIGGINMRTHGDFNLHSDANINLNATEQVRIVATGTPEELYTDKDLAVKKGHKAVGDVKVKEKEGQMILSSDYLMTLGRKGAFHSSQEGSIRTHAEQGISSFTNGPQLHGANSVIHLAGSQVHMNSTAASSDWGAKWLTQEAVGVQPLEQGDVDIAGKEFAVLQAGSKQTRTTVHRFVTHEPMLRVSSFNTGDLQPYDTGYSQKMLDTFYNDQEGLRNIFNNPKLSKQEKKELAKKYLTKKNKYGVLQMDDPEYDELDDLDIALAKLDELHKGSEEWKKLSVERQQWLRKAFEPGSSIYLEQANRLSDNLSIKLGQYQTDLQAYLKKAMGNSTDSAKAKKLAEAFSANYNKLYDLDRGTGLDVTGHIGNVLHGDMSFDQATASLKNKLTTQVVNEVRGETVQLFKDQIFTNADGRLFTIGDVSKEIQGTISGITGNLSLGTVAGASTNAVLTGLENQIMSGNFDFKSLSKGALASAKHTAINTAIGIGVDKAKSLLRQNLSAAGPMEYLQKDALRNVLSPKSLTSLGKNVMGGKVTSSTMFTSISTSFNSHMANLGTLARSAATWAGNAISNFFSDRRLKEDIRLIGKSPSGINVYSFKYYGIPGRYMGVMAQEVPWARHMTDTGFYAVDYSKVDVEFRRLH